VSMTLWELIRNNPFAETDLSLGPCVAFSSAGNYCNRLQELGNKSSHAVTPPSESATPLWFSLSTTTSEPSQWSRRGLGRPKLIHSAGVFEQGPKLGRLMLLVYVMDVRGSLVQAFFAALCRDARKDNQMLVIRQDVVNVDA
jgi:hypothetical protein